MTSWMGGKTAQEGVARMERTVGWGEMAWCRWVGGGRGRRGCSRSWRLWKWWRLGGGRFLAISGRCRDVGSGCDGLDLCDATGGVLKLGARNDCWETCKILSALLKSGSSVRRNEEGSGTIKVILTSTQIGRQTGSVYIGLNCRMSETIVTAVYK